MDHLIVSNCHRPWTPEISEAKYKCVTGLLRFRKLRIVGESELRRFGRVGNNWTSSNLTHTTKHNTSVFCEAVVLLRSSDPFVPKPGFTTQDSQICFLHKRVRMMTP
uniref:SFRICE_018612 n=1 Tax=Spodoptera frugiperda TaxID=7108 RepID=A0A2H1WWP1_SPOFR